MCGLAGFLDNSGTRGVDEMSAIVQRMAAALRHRGPDDCGVWVDRDAGAAIGHRRLSVLDLSANGRQPMASPCGRFVIALNGEIYNYRRLRTDLDRSGYPFRGESDTEVMLGAIGEWGLQAALSRFNGMFAFALWDRLERTLHLGRDRFGEKPLYYGWLDGVFVFGSELKALASHPAFRAEIDRDVLALYFRYNYVPAPFSIYRDIYKLPPACLLEVRPDAASSRRSFSPFAEETASCKPVYYWSLRQIAERGCAGAPRLSEHDAVEELDRLLADSVKLRMVADVPVGAFLSGGIDSSTVVGLMQAASSRPVKTFTIGAPDEEFDEATYARLVAQRLGTDHTELYVTAGDALKVIPSLPEIYDEPFSDSSQIPVYLVSQLARREVTVSLSGDGGDELFAGYNLYFWAQRVWSYSRLMPQSLRRLVARSLTLVPAPVWDKTFAACGPILPRQLKPPEPGDKLHRLAELLQADTQNALYHQLMSRWRAPAALVTGCHEALTSPSVSTAPLELPEYVQRMMYFDQLTYLPDDILVKVDRASMAVALEVRIPLLDYRVVEFAWRTPLFMKVQNGRRKWLLREVLRRYVPDNLIDRPKKGFSVPIAAWISGPLRDWAEELISPKRLREEGYLSPELVRHKWDEFLSGTRNWHRELWEVLMFEAWLQHSRRTVHA